MRNLITLEKMKDLEKEFISNVDTCGLHTFKQIKRSEHAAIYQRIRKDGTTHTYEAFRIRIVKAGTKLPNGLVVQEDYVSYPTKNWFGKTAYSCKTLEQAERRYEELIKTHTVDGLEDFEGDDSTPLDKSKTVEQIGATKGKRGRKAKDIKMPIPATGEKFTMKNLMAWSGESQANLYNRLKVLIENQFVGIAGEVREAHTRGKSQILYVSHTNDFVNDLPQGN